jgi:hypothetical protein
MMKQTSFPTAKAALTAPIIKGNVMATVLDAAVITE